MASRSVDFIFRLIDAFSPNAKQLEAAAKRSQAALDAMGQASNRLDKALASIKPPPLPQMAQGFDQVARSANNAATAVANAQKGMNARSWSSTYQSWRAENAKIDRDAAAWTAKQEAAAKKAGGGGMFGVGGSRLLHAYMGYHLARGAAHGVDHTLTRVGDVDTMRQRLQASLGGNAVEADAAVAKAHELSGKYRNTSVLENLKIIDDLRANLPEEFSHVLSETAEPFVKMHSFFKSWNGGKHAAEGERALQDISAAIRSGELTANMTGEQLADYTKNLAAARVIMGDKFKLHDYLTMTRQANIDLAGASKIFQMVDAPVLAQAMGAPRAGTALQSIGQRLVAGNRIQNQVAEGWRALDLVDLSVLSKSDFNKKGEIIGSHLKGKKWLKDSDLLASRATDYVMTRLMPALEKNGFTALKGAEMAKAWQDKNVNKLTHLLADFAKGEGNLAELRRRMGPLASDPMLAKALETLFERSGAILREEERIAQAQTENLKTYDAAKQKMKAQADRLLQTLTGKDFMANVAGAFDAIGDFFARTADQAAAIMAKNSPEELAKALGFASRNTGRIIPAKRGFGWEWETEFDTGLGLGANALANRAYMNPVLEARLAAQSAMDVVRNPSRYFTPAPTEFPSNAFGGAQRAYQVPPYTAPEPGYGLRFGEGMAGSIPQGEAQREITVRTTLDPIKVEVPPSVEVRVTGTVNGSVEGKGSISMKAEAPRGESSPVGK